MDDKSVNFVTQNNDDEAKSLKKVKSCKPIILLRRNSSGSITSKSSQAATAFPRSKNMTDIKPAISKIKTIRTDDSPHLTVAYNSTINRNKSQTTVINTKVPLLLKSEMAKKILPVQWTKVKEEPHIQPNVALNLLQTNAGCIQGLPFGKNFNSAASLPVQSQLIPSKPFLQQNFVQQPFSINTSVFAANRQYSAVRQLGMPVHNPHAMIAFANEQFQPQSQLPLDHCVYPSALPNPAAPVQFGMQENQQDFYLPVSAHSIVSKSAIVQDYSNPIFQVQNGIAQSSNNGTMLANTQSPVAQQQFDSVSDDSLTNITWLGRMGMNNFMPVPLEHNRKLEHKEKIRRPPYSYMALIQFAINSSALGKMTLRQIYQWIEEKFPYFRTAKPGWKNSIRHNLSLHDLFVREVAVGSKASFWTLRPDLNIRPLTLDSVASSSQGPVWSLHSCDPSQKSVLPTHPHDSRPYVLMPVPVVQNSEDRASAISKMEALDMMNPDGMSSSLLIDSGCTSDLSHCTSNASSKIFMDSSSILHDSGVAILKSEKKTAGPFPVLSRTSAKSSGKRARKERQKTLNDSLNSSLHFVKEGADSSTIQSSGEKLLLKKHSTKKERSTTKSVYFGLSDESFAELLNDLGSPFKTYLTQGSLENQGFSPRAKSARKRRRSWGSPEASGSGMEFEHHMRVANERTPVRRAIRRVKSDLVDLTQAIKNEDGLPTSTPLIKEKWKKIVHQRKKTSDVDDDKENVCPQSSFRRGSDSWRMNGRTSNKRFASPPSPILNPKDDPDIENNFFEDIIGSVFKTPDKPSAPVRHFDSLTPDRVPLSFVNTSLTNAVSGSMRNIGECSKAGDRMPLFSVISPSKEEPLNTSFSKLLDISGSSGFGRFNEADLNWSNFPYM